MLLKYTKTTKRVKRQVDFWSRESPVILAATITVWEKSWEAIQAEPAPIAVPTVNYPCLKNRECYKITSFKKVECVKICYQQSQVFLFGYTIEKIWVFVLCVSIKVTLGCSQQLRVCTKIDRDIFLGVYLKQDQSISWNISLRHFKQSFFKFGNDSSAWCQRQL